MKELFPPLSQDEVMILLCRNLSEVAIFLSKKTENDYQKRQFERQGKEFLSLGKIFTATMENRAKRAKGIMKGIKVKHP